MNRRRLLRRLLDGHLQNVAFRDLRDLVESFGFRLTRISGSHHIFEHARVNELLNLQDVSGEGKPYQIRQFLRVIERYDLRLEDEA
ncbi:MAG TPA: type II toxin-antitoxin system HicA family toxin [Thermoanaerobaculia bacterium]|nr:type II toxin-antitoxin system HicA family toxin [Thermoanaerobaculia bacterium]